LLATAAYVLAITTSGLFHNHALPRHGGGCCTHPAAAQEMCSHDGAGECADHFLPQTVAFQQSSDDVPCPVCQFLAQKPAPPVAVAPVSVGVLAQFVASPAPARVVSNLFSAWRSRAPPVAA